MSARLEAMVGNYQRDNPVYIYRNVPEPDRYRPDAVDTEAVLAHSVFLQGCDNRLRGK